MGGGGGEAVAGVAIHWDDFRAHRPRRSGSGEGVEWCSSATQRQETDRSAVCSYEIGGRGQDGIGAGCDAEEGGEEGLGEGRGDCGEWVATAVFGGRRKGRG